MTKQGEEVLGVALGLAENERAELAARLLESLATRATQDAVEAAWAAEIERRARRVRTHGPSGRDGDAVFERARRDLLGA